MHDINWNTRGKVFETDAARVVNQYAYIKVMAGKCFDKQCVAEFKKGTGETLEAQRAAAIALAESL